MQAAIIRLCLRLNPFLVSAGFQGQLNDVVTREKRRPQKLARRSIFFYQYEENKVPLNYLHVSKGNVTKESFKMFTKCSFLARFIGPVVDESYE